MEQSENLKATNDVNETKSKYTPARIRANKKWCDANIEHLREYRRQYIKKLYDENPEFREMKRIKNLERYHKKKELLKQQETAQILGN